MTATTPPAVPTPAAPRTATSALVGARFVSPAEDAAQDEPRLVCLAPVSPRCRRRRVHSVPRPSTSTFSRSNRGGLVFESDGNASPGGCAASRAFSVKYCPDFGRLLIRDQPWQFGPVSAVARLTAVGVARTRCRTSYRAVVPDPAVQPGRRAGVGRRRWSRSSCGGPTSSGRRAVAGHLVQLSTGRRR
jgi:hypothetical protein